MKKSNLMAILILGGLLAFASCTKENEPAVTEKPANTPPATMASINGTWKSSGTNMADDDEGSFSECILKVNADSSCTWTKKHKSDPTYDLVMTGRLLVEASGVKDAAGNFIDRIWFSFTRINGQDLTGSTHGIYQVNGNETTLDWTFMQNGVTYADPAKGFGSSKFGQRSISKYMKQ